MNKISTLALIAALGLAAPAFAQSPADTNRPEAPGQEIRHDKRAEEKAKHEEHKDRREARKDKREERKARHDERKAKREERKDKHAEEKAKHEEHHDEKMGQISPSLTDAYKTAGKVPAVFVDRNHCISYNALMQNLAARDYENPPRPMQLLQLDAIARAQASRDSYPHVIASGVLLPDATAALKRDFPHIKKTGYLPLSLLERKGAFDALLSDLESQEFAVLVGDKLGLELRGKPCIITVRKWSAAKDGRIHNDGEAKIATSLIYLNDTWPEGDDGRLRVLRSDKSFDDTAAEVPPTYGTFFAFARTENSWHGHKPFAGERRVIQMAWLRSWEDYERKEKRGRFSYFFKRLVSSSEY